MTRVLTGLFALGALVTILYVPVRATTQSAVVIKDDTCGLLDGDGGFAAGTSMEVSTHGGVTNYTCRASGLNNSTGQAVIWNFDNTGYLCGTSGGSTTDWQEVVSASGNATLKCQVKNK